MPSNQILVIEDHPLFATGIKDLVEFVATNADILCAASIAHAKELFSKNSPALVITDLRLPDCQGQDVIDTLALMSANLNPGTLIPERRVVVSKLIDFLCEKHYSASARTKSTFMAYLRCVFDWIDKDYLSSGSHHVDFENTDSLKAMYIAYTKHLKHLVMLSQIGKHNSSSRGSRITGYCFIPILCKSPFQSAAKCGRCHWCGSAWIRNSWLQHTTRT